MVRDKKAHHDSIIEAATKEFMEYGFTDASMRRIASSAGMSVSGLYKHFPSKEEMFAELVEPTLQGFRDLYDQLADQEFAALDQDHQDALWEDSSTTAQMLKYIYSHLREFKLIILRSSGTRYENFVHECAEKEEKKTYEYIRLAEEKGFKVNRIDPEEFHLLVTTNLNAIIAAVEHDFTKEQAMHYAKTVEIFFASGWKSIMGI